MKVKGKQVSLFTMAGFRRNLSSSNEHSQELLHEMKRASKDKLKFQEYWFSKCKCLQEDLETSILWCSYCRSDPHCKSLFGKTCAKYFKIFALEEHARSVAYRDAILLQERDKNGLEKCASKKKASADLVIEKLFKCAYYIAKKDFAFGKWESLLWLLRVLDNRSLRMGRKDRAESSS